MSENLYKEVVEDLVQPVDLSASNSRAKKVCAVCTKYLSPVITENKYTAYTSATYGEERAYIHVACEGKPLVLRVSKNIG